MSTLHDGSATGGFTLHDFTIGRIADNSYMQTTFHNKTHARSDKEITREPACVRPEFSSETGSNVIKKIYNSQIVCALISSYKNKGRLCSREMQGTGIVCSAKRDGGKY